MRTIYTELDTEEIKKELKEMLSEERYIHSISTAETAVSLAERFNCDKEKAYVAGLLHDCAKCLPVKNLQDIIKNCGYTLCEGEECNNKTLHAPVSSFLAKKNFGISNEEILSSIRWHTIGKPNMSSFEKIIFLSDKIEPKTREDEFRLKIQNPLNTTNSLDIGMLASFKLTINSLIERNLPICFQTIEVYNNLLTSAN